jgi:hypothetical protein
MKPTIGRIVLFSLPATYWIYVEDNDRIRPAIITRIHDDHRVNLRVVNDPTDVFMVTRSEQENVLEGAGTAGRWFWPPRV